MITDTRDIPKSASKAMAFWVSQFRADWRGEVPMKLHEGHGGLGAAPAFTHAFNDYIGRMRCESEHCHECRCRNMSCDRCYSRREQERASAHTVHRSRVQRAFRKLRQHAPREYDVLTLMCKQGLSLQETRDRLNERSVSRGKLDEQLDLPGVFVLAMSATDKMKNWL